MLPIGLGVAGLAVMLLAGGSAMVLAGSRGPKGEPVAPAAPPRIPAGVS